VATLHRNSTRYAFLTPDWSVTRPRAAVAFGILLDRSGPKLADRGYLAFS